MERSGRPTDASQSCRVGAGASGASGSAMGSWGGGAASPVSLAYPWVNRGTTNRRIAVGNEIAHEVEVERAVEKPVEVVGRHEVVQREVIDGREETLFDSQHHARSHLVWKDAIVLPRSHPLSTGWEVIATAIGLGLARFILSGEPLRVGVVERFAMSCWWIAGESAEPLDIRG